MGLRDFAKKRVSTDLDALHAERLQHRYDDLEGVQRIADVAPRVPVRVIGEVQRQRVVPRAGSPMLEVTISDGTGSLVAQFTGRRSVGGLEHGRGLLVEGVARADHGRLVILNPVYTLQPKG